MPIVKRDDITSITSGEDPAITRSHIEREAKLREMHPDNWSRKPLPHAPCVRVKRTGEILPWTDGFAERSDLCEACDIHGNTDPASWGGVVSTPVSAAPVEINTTVPERQQGDIHAPDIKTAPSKLGLDKNFAQDFTEPVTRNEALRLPAQKAVGLSVNDIVDAVFAVKQSVAAS